MKIKIAKIISILLGPLWLPILFIVVISNANLTSPQVGIIFPSVLILQVVIPILYVIIAPRLGWVSSWDIKDRRERLPFFLLIVVLTFLSFIIVTLFGNKLLFHFNIIFIVLLLVLGAITKYWKISLHASLNTGAVIILNYFYGSNLIVLCVLIPIVFWSRLALKRHTWSQLVGGTIITAVITCLGLKFFQL